MCGDVLINPGDIVFGDLDGVVVIPQEIADQVIAQAYANAEKEDQTREMLMQGALLQDAYDKYGVL